MTGRRGLGICAIGALDMALWDLRGKAEGKPVWEVLGGKRQPHAVPYASLLPDGDALDTYTESLVARAEGARNSAFAPPSWRSASRVPTPTTRSRSRTTARSPTW